MGSRIMSEKRKIEVNKMSYMKGQLNLEYLSAALIYLIALGTLVFMGQGVLPEFTDDVDELSKNMEARQVSTQMLTAPGRHGFETDNLDETEWEYNESTVNETLSFGLASDFLDVDRDKLDSIESVTTETSEELSYSDFRRLTQVEHSYRFEFIWMPVIDTHEEFLRGEGEDNEPMITEPEDDLYWSADNTVKYGSENLTGEEYHFLVTSHNGVFNTSYVSDDEDFEDEEPIGVGDVLEFEGSEDSFEIEEFQNRDDEPGNMLVLSQEIKRFGPQQDSDSTVLVFNRYAMMEDQPLRVRMLVW